MPTADILRKAATYAKVATVETSSAGAVEAAAEAARLGAPVRRFVISGMKKVGSGLFAVAVGGFMLFALLVSVRRGGLPTRGVEWAGDVFGMVLGGGLTVYGIGEIVGALRVRGQRIEVFEKGLVRAVRGRIDVFPWATSFLSQKRTEYRRHYYRRTPSHVEHELTLARTDGVVLQLDSGLSGQVVALGQVILEEMRRDKISHATTALDAGRMVHFGEIQLSREGVHELDGRLLLRWVEVERLDGDDASWSFQGRRHDDLDKVVRMTGTAPRTTDVPVLLALMSARARAARETSQ